MNRLLTAFLFLFASARASAQNTDALLREAFKLYYSERASWLGTDILMEELARDQRDSIGGYISYVAGEERGQPTFVFYTKNEPMRALGSVVFDTSFQKSSARVSTTSRTLSPLEKELIDLRQRAMNVLESDTSVRAYRQTKFNLVPISDGRGKRVYVLTATNQSGKVLFGNDYLLEFSRRGDFKHLSRLHNSLLVAETSSLEGSGRDAAYTHSHLPQFSETFTATDLCTAMLYEDYAPFTQYYVVSAKKVSIWSVKGRKLLVMDRTAFDRMARDMEDRENGKGR